MHVKSGGGSTRPAWCGRAIVPRNFDESLRQPNCGALDSTQANEVQTILGGEAPRFSGYHQLQLWNACVVIVFAQEYLNHKITNSDCFQVF